MQLSKRLQAVADLVTPGNRVADVGCDHAYISIYLIEHEISPQIIAMDVNQGPIDRAKENIIKYRCDDRIETRKSNGLQELKPGEADTILIAGMGGALTIQILTERTEVLKSARELVLQPQSEIHKVRHMLQENNLFIIEENMMKEDEKYYVMMKAVPKNLLKDSTEFILKEEEQFNYGKLLLEQRNPVLYEFLLWDLSLCEGIIRALLSETTDNSLLRQKEMKERIAMINCGLGYFDPIT